LRVLAERFAMADAKIGAFSTTPLSIIIPAQIHSASLMQPARRAGWPGRFMVLCHWSPLATLLLRREHPKVRVVINS